MAQSKIPKGYQGTYGTASDGTSTLIMVSRNVDLTAQNKSNKKGVTTMASKPKANTAANNNFKPDFRKYSDMNSGEQAAFRQGAKTVENKVKENLGFKKPR